jgi:hypothetical protein
MEVLYNIFIEYGIPMKLVNNNYNLLSEFIFFFFQKEKYYVEGCKYEVKGEFGGNCFLRYYLDAPLQGLG